ncbi:MAG: ATP-binding protein, partial [Verrucomicrobiae bacterium]|nr:ATP-binding protein [Verrucomicrobiae bacterium]
MSSVRRAETRAKTEEDDLEDRNFGTSPYNTGSPVESADMLFGRDQTLEEIRTQLPSEGRANVILLEGNRRAGKTSILKRIQKADFLPNWIVAYCSLQSGEGAKEGTGVATAEVFRILARSIGEQLIKEGIDIWLPGHTPPDPSRSLCPQFRLATQEVFSGPYPFETFENFLIECLDAVKPKRLLLCLDEFDKLQEGIDSGVTSSQVPENIRYLIHEYPDFAAILTGSRRLKRLREEYWSALFGLGDRIGVSALSEEAAQELVTRPVEGRLAYSPDSVTEIIRVTARQPFLIQS